jgi:hypothetical protein
VGEKLDSSPLPDPNAGERPAAVALEKRSGANPPGRENLRIQSSENVVRFSA